MDAPKSLEHCRRIRRQFRFADKRQRAVHPLQRRLRSRAQDGGDAAKFLQKIHRRIKEMRAAHGQRLDLVKDEDAVLQRMQPPHRTAVTCKKRIEELHLRRENHWHIPALRQKTTPVHALVVFPCNTFRQHIGMMLQDGFIVPKYIANLLGILLNDRSIGNHEDNSFLSIQLCMAQREPHAGKRLASACRHGKLVGSRSVFRCPQTIVADLLPKPSNLLRRLLLRHRKTLEFLF